MKYIITVPIVKVKGESYYTTEADSLEQALANYESGNAEHIGDEFEWMEHGKPEVQE